MYKVMKYWFAESLQNAVVGVHVFFKVSDVSNYDKLLCNTI